MYTYFLAEWLTWNGEIFSLYILNKLTSHFQKRSFILRKKLIQKRWHAFYSVNVILALNTMQTEK